MRTVVDEALKSRPDTPIWLITGAESLLVDAAVDAVVAAVSPQCGPPAFNITSVRLGDGGGAGALAGARTLPMMADRRLVVLRDLQEADDAFFEALQHYAEGPSTSTTLVVSGTGFPKVRKGGKNWKARLKKPLDGVAFVAALNPKDVSPARFARDHAQAQGHSLGSAEARLLVELVGTDLSRLAREIDKACTWVDPGAPLDAEALHAACSLVAETEVWDLTAGIVAREPGPALACLHRLLEAGEPSHRLIALIGWQLRLVLRARELQRSRTPDRQIASTLRLRPDVHARIRRLLQQGFPPGALVLSRLARANRAMNHHKAGDRRILEHLVVELATGSLHDDASPGR